MSESENNNEFEFKAETQRILSLVINSLYTNKEVFLRELISNASDALDKARYLQLSEKDSVREQEGTPAIDITLDKENKTLTIADNGLGMTREEVIDHLGTIAHSGTGDFVEKLAKLKQAHKEHDALELIGQFGVGFYAAFMVASRVDVQTLSMRNGSEPVLWRSAGDGKYNVLPGEREAPGTTITLHLKEDAEEYAEDWRIEAIITKYSDFVMFPIRLGDKVVNSSSALWRTPRSQVSDEQHAEFFKHLTQGRVGDAPLLTVHYSVDAPVQFSALMYVPEKAPSDMFTAPRGAKTSGLRLYAKRVMIMEHCDQVLPVYLRFLRGVVDSEDLTLNVSRETLQENRTVRQIESQLTKQVLKQLGKLADSDEEQYLKIWRLFGQVLKEGVSVDWTNKDTIAKLCRYASLNADADALISFDKYIADKTHDKKEIYFITGAGRDAVINSPHLEVFRKKGIDVLLMVDPIDEWVVQALAEYEGHKLVSVTHGDIELDDNGDNSDDSDDGDNDNDKPTLEAAIEAIKKALGTKVSDVRPSTRLTETASCLVSRKGDPGANLERLMKMFDERAQEKKRILEVNTKHPIVLNIGKLAQRDADSDAIKLWSEVLLDQAQLSEGVVEDPHSLVQRIQALLVAASTKAVE